MSWFEDKLLEGAIVNGLFNGVNKIFAAVSGGADSVAMVHALHRLRQEGRLMCDVVIGHVNHGLRGAESDGDEAFVRELGNVLGIAVAAKTADVRTHAAAHKLSIETAGRALRLKALAAMMRDNGCDAVATAHHKDDLAETLIHRLMRGTGFRGLCGIWPVSDVYGAMVIRPMLDIRRSEIVRYCTENHLVWREDASNRAIDFTRNRIRHRLLPVLENDSETIAERLSALSFKSRVFLIRVEKQARSILERGRFDKASGQFVIEQHLLRDCPPWVFYETVRQILVKLGVGLRDYKQGHFDALWGLLEQNKAKAHFPDEIEATAEKGRVLIRRKCPSIMLPHKPVSLKMGETVTFGQWKISSRLFNRDDADVEQFLKNKNSFTEWFDADKIAGSIKIRQRQSGERFWPIGGPTPKNIARFLLDSGLDTQTRQEAFVVADTEKVLWLAPIRMSEPAKLTRQTSKIVEIRLFACDF
ncbi:MAG: tRNA lysidine(34) synthetase TilS [Planctomycetales bacterium]|nr:tRNA lysidine(34) synthetase TilS [Planctomycetales bacterium]